MAYQHTYPTAVPPARRVLEQQLNRLKGWAAKARPQDLAKIDQRKEELRALFILLEYVEEMQGHCHEIMEKADRLTEKSYWAGYADHILETHEPNDQFIEVAKQLATKITTAKAA